MLIEVEVKALINGHIGAEDTRRKILELGGDFVSKERQKNFYYLKPTKQQCLNLAKEFGEIAEIYEYLDKAQSISLRLRKINNDNCKLVAKVSLDSDAAANGISRIEVEKDTDINSIEDLDVLFQDNGLVVQSKWSRHRETYTLNSCIVTLDYNAGYGYVCEVEKVVTAEVEQSEVEKEVKHILSSLDLEELNPDRLERMFRHYNATWKEYYGSEKVFVIE